MWYVMSFNSMEIWVNVQNGRGLEGKQVLWLGTDREYFSRMSPVYCWKHVRGLHGLITEQRHSSWSPLPHLLFCLKKPTFFLPHTALCSTFSSLPHSVRSPERLFTDGHQCFVSEKMQIPLKYWLVAALSFLTGARQNSLTWLYPLCCSGLV